MTIDEAKKELQDIISTNGMLKDDDFLNMLINSLDGLKDAKNKYEAQTDVIAQMDQELNWWRGQDLIPRKDALERIENLKRSERHIDHVITLHHSYCAIGEIPKAEPHHTTVDERNGDCETCKHYIPKEKE